MEHFLSLQIEPPTDAPVTWYRTTALKKTRKYGAIYLTPFSHRLEEEIDDPELQRLIEMQGELSRTTI
jgi:hypothetical protein